MKNLTLARSIRTIACMSGCLWTAMTLAQPAAPADALRELNIMSNIFQASMTDKNNRRIGMSPPQTLYLAGQGMVFTFNLPGGNFWQNSSPGNGFANGDFNFDFDFDFDYDDNGQGVPAVKINGNNKNDTSAAANYRRQLQELNNRMRDKQEDMRDQQRKLRDMQRAQRGDSGKANTAETEKLNKSMETLGNEMQTLGNNIAQLQQEYQNERNAEAEARHKQQTGMIFDTLCKYGSTLQSLKNGEHVNVVLHNYAGNKTLVYVLDHDKLTGCKSPDALLKAANSYSMESR